MKSSELNVKILDQLGSRGNGVLNTRGLCNLAFEQITKDGSRIIPGRDKMGENYRALKAMSKRGLVLQVAPTLWKLVK